MPKSADELETRAQYIGVVKRFEFFIVLGLIASTLIYLAIVLFSGVSSVATAFQHISPYIYLLAFVCVFASYCVRFLKWDYLTSRMRLKVSKARNFIVYLSTNANVTPGGVGSLIAAYTLKKLTNRRFVDLAPIVIMDMFTDFFGFALFALAVAVYFDKYVIYVLILDLILIVPYLFFINPWAFSLIKRKKKKGFITNKILEYGKRYYVSQNVLNKPKTYLVSLIYTMPADFLNSMALYFSLLATGIKPKLLFSVFTFSVAQITGIVSTVPAGIGTSDITFTILLKAEFALTGGLNSAVTIMTRLAYMWFGIAVGLIALLYTIRYWKK